MIMLVRHVAHALFCLSEGSSDKSADRIKNVPEEDKKTSKNLSWLSRQQPPRYTQTPKEQT